MINCPHDEPCEAIADAYERGRYDATREAYGCTAESYEKGLAEGMNHERNRIADALEQEAAKAVRGLVDQPVLWVSDFAERLRKGEV